MDEREKVNKSLIDRVREKYYVLRCNHDYLIFPCLVTPIPVENVEEGHV